VVAFALAIIFTWPLAAQFGTGGRIDSGDGRFSIWNIAWVAHALTTNPAELWNANIFSPHAGTLAFSEANIVAGVIATPVWLLTHNPYAASNWTILCTFAMAAVAMFALVRHLTGSRWAAAVTGVLYAFCSYTFAHLPHIQLLMTFGPPLALLRMHLFVERPSARNAVWLGLAVAIQALACGYYGVFGGLAVAFGIGWFAAWSGHYRSLRFWLHVAAAGLIALVLVVPFLLPYLEIQRGGFARSLEDARIFRASWRAYLASALLVYQWILPLIGHWREVLFPGFLSIGFASVAVFHAWRRPALMRAISTRRVVFFYLLLTLLAAWGSLGPDAGLYRLLFEVVPFMSLLRAPARLGLLVTMSLVVMAGIGVAILERGWNGSRRRVWLTALVIATLARSTTGPLDWVEAPPTPRAITWLSRLPRGVVAEFPFYGAGGDMFQQTRYMLMSTWHWQPLLNGYSDFVPADIAATLAPLSRFPSHDAMRVLRDRDARYVLVHWKMYSPEQQRQLRQDIGEMPTTLRLMLSDPDASLYELTTTAVADPS
jgi:hypothetical protein